MRDTMASDTPMILASILFDRPNRAAKGEMPPLKQRIEYKFHNAWVAERCSLLASRLFKAAGTAGIAAELPFGRILADITVGRQHISNQFEQVARSYGATLFGIENNKDFVL